MITGFPRTLLNKRRLVVCSALLLVFLLLAAWLFRSRTTTGNLSPGSTVAAADRDENAPDVYQAQRDTIEKRLILDGELRAVNSKTVFASTSEEAKITYLPPEGTYVKAGDRLVELDSTTVLDRIKEVEERIIAAENEIVKTSSTQESALRDMAVELSKLWLAYEQAKVKARAPAELVSRREHQENQLALETTKTEYENQLAKIEQKKKEHAAELQVKTIENEKLRVQLNQANNSLGGMNIKAPSDGMVIYSDHWAERRKLQIGDVVWGGFPLVRLPDLKEMEVVAQVNEVDGPRLSIGQKAKILLDSYPDIEISGSVKSIAQTAVKASWMAKAKVFLVIISMEKTVTEIMKPGMSAQVSIVVADYGSQLLVPRSAVEFDADSAKVVRLETDNQKRPVSVTILYSDPLYYAVADNGALKEGDKLLKSVSSFRPG